MCYDCLWFEMCRYFGLYLLQVQHVVSDLICFILHFHHDERKRGEIDQVDGSNRRVGSYKRLSACRGKHGDTLGLVQVRR